RAEESLVKGRACRAHGLAPRRVGARRRLAAALPPGYNDPTAANRRRPVPAPPMLADVLAGPENEGLRRVCADWPGGPGAPARADFIRTQLELARLPPSSPRLAELEDRADDLLAEHEERWLGPPPGPLFEWRFRGGFVDEIVLNGPPWVED